METRRFDELTVALARGGSRRGVLRGLAGGLLGALALDRSGALAKNDKDKSEKAEAKPEQPEQGGGNPEQGGRPIISPAKPVCRAQNDTGNCPTCFEARFGVGVDPGDPDRDGPGCCDPNGREKDCKNCQYENATYCSQINNNPATEAGPAGTCVTTTCVQVGGQLRCNYDVKNDFCNNEFGDGWSCCPVFTSSNFGHCINAAQGDTCQQDV
jgi:hypothetical protein